MLLTSTRGWIRLPNRGVGPARSIFCDTLALRLLWSPLQVSAPVPVDAGAHINDSRCATLPSALSGDKTHHWAARVVALYQDVHRAKGSWLSLNTFAALQWDATPWSRMGLGVVFVVVVVVVAFFSIFFWYTDFFITQRIHVPDSCVYIQSCLDSLVNSFCWSKSSAGDLQEMRLDIHLPLTCIWTLTASDTLGRYCLHSSMYPFLHNLMTRHLRATQISMRSAHRAVLSAAAPSSSHSTIGDYYWYSVQENVYLCRQ